MKIGFYPKLAWVGIRKNRQLYLPYVLTCIGMVMMHYIISFLAASPTLRQTAAASVICGILYLGSYVIALFALLFLFYTNSFLMRRRKKEFGLYNILGMGKGNISKILFWEMLIVAGLALAGGLGLGITLSKLFELLLVNLMKEDVSFSFMVSGQSILSSLSVFSVIFVLLFLNNLRQISLRKPVELIRSESAGEKPPKANWLAGLLGLVILAAAYYLAITVEEPITAISVFFMAVMMVICATELLFVSGSVALCKLLQKSKAYYYQSKHFVSVSSMSYRMKRNGAGLASICILLTMVLVMLSSTAALYVEEENFLHTRYPKDFNLYIDSDDLQQLQKTERPRLLEQVQAVLAKQGAEPQQEYDYLTVATSGSLEDGVLYTDSSTFKQLQTSEQASLVLTFFVSVEDYNHLMGEEQTLKEDEVLIYPFHTEYTQPTFQVRGKECYQVKQVVDSFVDNGESVMTIFPTIFVFVPDLDAVAASLGDLANFEGDSILEYRWTYAFDTEIPAANQLQLYEELMQLDGVDTRSLECLEQARSDFYGVFGGLFFLGMLLSLVFLAAAVLILYYKQISEGYEDCARFEILQKVGMTRKEIRKTIHSQMLTVFFLPLGMAGVHLCFSFPMISKLLLTFNLRNTKLLVLTGVVCFLIFGAFYAMMYWLTSNRYAAIVSRGNRE